MTEGKKTALVTAFTLVFFGGCFYSDRLFWGAPCLPERYFFSSFVALASPLLLLASDSAWQFGLRRKIFPDRDFGWKLLLLNLFGSLVFSFSVYSYFMAYSANCYCRVLLGLELGQKCYDAGNHFAHLVQFVLSWACWGISRLIWAYVTVMRKASAGR